MERKYVEDYRHLHATQYGFGGRHMATILPHIMALRPASLIDYGAGRSEISSRVAAKVGCPEVARFDPAVAGIDKVPEKTFELAMSCDVLEHIPDDELDAVLAELARLGRHQIHVIDMKPARATLLDGRNAHLSLHDAPWWQNRLSRFFPGLRPVKAQFPGWCAFKTWPAEVSAPRRWWIEWTEGRAWEKQRAENRRRKRERDRAEAAEPSV
ncbi:class I SAM-dependent methyltransferase [Prosthecomicrobium sp. N25]|uniref:class I SAM-dependent methyltransferase n=1 Tax=Prosthecomicrobium sp. N25 TaxID=3129254 RepID=UPI0030777E64